MRWRFRGRSCKACRVVRLVVLVIALTIFFIARPAIYAPTQVYGVTFSWPHAEGLGLDWQEAYDATLTDLGVRRLRLAAYWEQIEPAQGQFDFTPLDYQMDEAAAHGTQVILAVGRKLPRWPECHVPAWAEALPELEQQEQVLAMLPVVVERYRDHPALRMWQLENEPLLDYGECPPEDREFLRREEALVRSLDAEHPILITDSGELNWWITAAGFGDVMGTTVYRTVFSERTQKIFHYDYIFPAWVYRGKARMVNWLRGKDVLISELQGEPWGAVPYTELSVADRRASLTPERLGALQQFAARTQLPEAYWWGVEYWYWEKEVNGEPAFWNVARAFF